MTILLAIWGAALSTVLACVSFYDRYVKHTGRLKIVIERFKGYWQLNFTCPVRWIHAENLPRDSAGQLDISEFDNIICFSIINMIDVPVEVRFAEVVWKKGWRQKDHHLLHGENRPLGTKLSTRHAVCVYAICESSISNGSYLFEKPAFPCDFYLEIETAVGKRFRSKPFVVDEIHEESFEDEPKTPPPV